MKERQYRLDRLQVGRVKVDETDDFYVIEQSVATRPGVFNRALREKDELAKSWGFLEGVPIGVNHPPEDEVHHGLLYVYPEEVHGFVADVKFDDKSGAVSYSAFFFKRVDTPGYHTTPEIVAQNKAIATAIKGGAAIDNSPGYLSRVVSTKGTQDGREYEEIRRDFMFYHLAIVPQGACGWSDVCGLGRGAADSSQESDTVTGQAPLNPPKPAGDCAGTHAELDALRAKASRVDDLEKKAAKADALETELKTLREAQQKMDAERLAQKRSQLAEVRKVDAKTFEAYPEAVLDAELALAKKTQPASAGDASREARADNADFTPARDSVQSGMTVGAWDGNKWTA